MANPLINSSAAARQNVPHQQVQQRLDRPKHLLITTADLNFPRLLTERMPMRFGVSWMN